jgi:hypothetical protein
VKQRQQQQQEEQSKDEGQEQAISSVTQQSLGVYVAYTTEARYGYALAAELAAACCFSWVTIGCVTYLLGSKGILQLAQGLLQGGVGPGAQLLRRCHVHPTQAQRLRS